MPRIMIGWVDVHGGLWKNFVVFYVKVNPNPEVDFSPWKSGHYVRKQYLAVFVRQLQRLLEQPQFFDVKVDYPEVDSPGVVRTWKPGHYFNELPEDV